MRRVGSRIRGGNTKARIWITELRRDVLFTPNEWKTSAMGERLCCSVPKS